MSGQLSPWLSRLLAVALLVFALWAVFAVAVAPLFGLYGGYATSIDQSARLLDRYRAIARDLPALNAEVDELKGADRHAQGFLPAASETLAAADLQNQLKHTIESAGGALQSMQTLPQRIDGGSRRITIRVQMSGSTEAVQKVLYAIDAAKPFLFSDNVDIEGRRERNRSTSDEHIVLDTRLDVFGYLHAAPP